MAQSINSSDHSNSRVCNTTAYCGILRYCKKDVHEYKHIEKNYAFLDIQNVYQGTKERGWKIHWPSFHQYLHEKYNVIKSFVFIGFIKGNQWLYDLLGNAGFELEYKHTRRLRNGQIDGGNIDADLTSAVMDYKTEYSKAVIVGDDGDYYRTIQSLSRQDKLKLIISSHLIKNTSEIIKQVVRPEQMLSIHSLRNQIAYSHTK